MSSGLNQNAATGAPASNWKPYPAYKDSGVEWLGKVPEHWEILKLKYTDKVIMGQSPSSEDYNDTHSGLPFLQGNAEFGNINPNPKIWCEKANKTASIGDILVSVRAPIGAVNLADQEYGIGRGLCAIRTNKSNNKYLYYLFICLNDELNSIGTGSTYTAISVDEVENIKIPYLELSEQKSISLYLDDRTRKIDSLIEKKQKMIELLKEERAAVINQAVTKGLNLDAPIKDSGIEWLGEVPEHWNIVRLKLISKIKYGLGEPPKQKEDGIPLIRATNIDRGKIIEKDLVLVDPKDVPYERDPVLKKDDIIVVRSGAYTADSAIIPQKYDGAIAGYDMVVRVVKASPKYIAFALLSQYVLINQLYLQRMRAAQPHLNAEELGGTLILIPPKNEEQQAIIQLIESESAKIDSAVSIIQKEILLLQEYRTALISEVVTGKIDVREAI